MSTFHLHAPFRKEALERLRSGDRVLLSGSIYTARDAAHMRLEELLSAGRRPPFDLRGSVIFYAGPAPERPGQIINSTGPTTSSRMDRYTPILLEHGLRGAIGKGPRSIAVRDAMLRHGCVYFVAVGGAAASLADCVTASEIVAWNDLGPEAVRKLAVENMPVLVANDLHGNDLFEEGISAYRREDGR